MQLKKSKTVTHICKVCFKEISYSGLRNFIGDELCICRYCFEKLKPQFLRYKTLGIPSLSLYYYDEGIQSMLYQFKGALDYELKDAFISYLSPLLKLYYHGYTLIPVPSSKEREKERGFNQVIEIFSQLGFPLIKAIIKTKNHVQHENNMYERKKVSEVLSWVEGTKIKGKKILLVDDVYTTGSTAKACLKLIKKHNPKKLKLLTMAKTRNLNDRS